MAWLQQALATPAHIKAKIHTGVRHREAYDAAGLQASQTFSQKYRGLPWTL
jgi:hypothetical protein